MKVLICENRAQRVDERNGVICLVIMFTPKVMKMSKLPHFMYLLLISADHSKASVAFWAKYLGAFEKF